MANGPFWVWKRAGFFPYTAEQEAVYIESLTDSSQQSCGVGTNNLTSYLWGQDQSIRKGTRTWSQRKVQLLHSMHGLCSFKGVDTRKSSDSGIDPDSNLTAQLNDQSGKNTDLTFLNTNKNRHMSMSVSSTTLTTVTPATLGRWSTLGFKAKLVHLTSPCFRGPGCSCLVSEALVEVSTVL